MSKPLIFNLLFTVLGLAPAAHSRVVPGKGDDYHSARSVTVTGREKGCAGAVDPQQPATEPIIFGDLDKNRNNYWERKEVSRFKSIDSQWNKLDKNGNGRVSRDEFNEYLNEVGPLLLSRWQIRSLFMPEAKGECVSGLSRSVFAVWASIQNRDG